jgi:hypothetical protein
MSIASLFRATVRFAVGNLCLTARICGRRRATMYQLMLHKVASRILQPLGQPAMALAISAVVLVLGVAALIAIWMARPPVDRVEYVF